METNLKPYPEIDPKERNLSYGKLMLDNIGGENSEMTAISLYTYNLLITGQELSKLFHEIAVTEMHHLKIFGKLALALGENPRLWTQKKSRYIYWSPMYTRYPMPIRQLLEHAADSEREAIRKYRGQISMIQNQNIRDNLARIIEDEELHLKQLTAAAKKLL